MKIMKENTTVSSNDTIKDGNNIDDNINNNHLDKETLPAIFIVKYH